MWNSHAVEYSRIVTMFAGTGVIFAAVYLLWMVQRVFFGKVTNAKNRGLQDLSAREIGLIAPLVLLMVFMGVYPAPFLNRSKESVAAIQQRVSGQEKGGTITEVTEHK
jgi:NADH-quinone oxidoreductase subunit M